MKRVTKICVLVLAAFCMVCATGIYAPEVTGAAQQQKRVTWKHLDSKIIKKDDGKLYLRVRVALKNNSTDERSISKYYDKTLKISGVVTRKKYYPTLKQYGSAEDVKFNYTHTSSIVNTPDIFPGKSWNSHFDILLTKVLGKQYAAKTRDGYPYSYSLKSIKAHSLDFKYKTERI